MTKDGAAPLAAFVLAAFIFPFAYLLLAAPTPSFFLTSLDHGYQLAVADMLLAGKVQGVDFFTHYGPFVGYASGAARMLGGKFIGEVVLCAAGYGASCALIFGLVARFGGRHAAAIAVISFLMLLPRFYKWYYCFFPLVAIALSLALVDRLRARQSVLLLLLGFGVVSGIALFFRMDLGLQHAATVLFALLAGHLASASDSERDWTQRLLLLIGHGTAVVAGVALVTAAYAVLLESRSGTFWSIAEFFQGLAASARLMVEHYSLPWPAIDRNSFWTHQSAFAIAYYATPLLYLVSAALAGWRLSRHSLCSLDLAVLIVAVSGLGLFPQAMSRVDVHHYLQVTAPLLVLLGILLGAPATGIARRAQRVGAAGLFGLLLIGVAPKGALDMASPWRNPITYWRELANLPASRPDDAMGAMTIRLRQLVPPGRPIFFASAWSLSGVLVASERPMAGAIPAYAPGVVDHPRWKVLNLKALREYPPQALVVYGPTWDAGLASEIAPYDPSLIHEWRERFTSVAYDQGNWRILLAP